MRLNFEVPSALEHFRCLVSQDQDLPLLEAAASLALDTEPGLDLQDVLFQADRLSRRLRQGLPAHASALQRTFLLNEFFYERLGFGVNANDFSDPANSYMHRVLDTRKGIPISLAVLWMELAASIGLTAQGISFPGHFMVKVYVGEGIIIQDPLTGQGLTQEALTQRLEPFRHQWGLAQDEMAPLHMFLAPASRREIIERMLRNLQAIHEQEADLPLLLAVLNRLVILRPQECSTYRDRGLVLAQMGQNAAALQDLQTYARTAVNPQDLPLIEARMEQLRGAP